MLRKDQLPPRSFSNNNLGEQTKIPDAFSSDRRWVLGTRQPPVQIEKAGKFPPILIEKVDKSPPIQNEKVNEHSPIQKEKVDTPTKENITMYAQSGIYSMHIYNHSHIIFKCKNETNKDIKNPVAVETISPAPAGGFLISFAQRGLIYFTYFGIHIPIGLSEDNSEKWNVPISLTSFYWLMPSNQEIFCLFGSMFGHVYKMTIVSKAQNIPVQKLCEDKNKTPVSSISSILYNDVRYLLVTTFKNLRVLEWSSPEEISDEEISMDTPSGPNVCVPSFVCSNETHVSWLTHDDLRIYDYKQIVGGKPGCLILGFEELNKILDIKESSAFLAGAVKPIIMSKYYTIIVGPNSIVGFSTDDVSVAFRYPLSSNAPLLSMHFDQQLNQIHVATEKRLYNINLNTEKKTESFKSIKQVKEALIEKLETSKEVRAAEVLSTLLEANDFKSAVQMLQKHLERVVQQSREKEQQKAAAATQNANKQNQRKSPVSKPADRLSTEKVQMLCEEFFIFELMVIFASENNQPQIFKPRMIVDTDGQFDVFAALSKLLQLRAFSSVSDCIKNKDIISMSKDSPLSVRMLLEDGQIVSAVDKILSFGPSASTESLSSIVFKYRNLLKDPKNKFYSRIDEKAVRDFVLSILPFIAGDLPRDSAFKLLKAELLSRQPKQVDLLLWTLTNSAEATVYDKEVYDDLKLKIASSPNLLVNPFTSMQHCLKARMYRTSAAIASSCGLHEEAVLAAKQVVDDQNLVRHFIKKAPRPIQSSLCRTAEIEMGREDGDSAIRAASKDMVIDELGIMMKKLDNLKKKFSESEDFFQTLQKWGNEENAGSSICSFCQKSLIGFSGYTFPCGHSFHDSCLLKAAEPTFSTREKDILFRYRKTQGTEDRKWLEEKITDECPLCGMVSVESIKEKLEDDDVYWPISLSEIIGLVKK